MIAPDDSITITNNIVGGSGKVRSGKEVVVGSQTLPPQYTGISWAGTAKPVSGGYFTGGSDLTYSFTVGCDIPSGCLVGQDVWSLGWNDGTNSGTVAFDSTYNSPSPVSVGTYGLQLSFISGTVVNGNAFTISARTPRDTFQYTINYEPYTEPIVIVSYNDPQGNHRFVLPEATMNLTTPSMIWCHSVDHADINGLKSTTTVPSWKQYHKGGWDNPTERAIQGGHLFLELRSRRNGCFRSIHNARFQFRSEHC